jgi:prephenate dehydrogenase
MAVIEVGVLGLGRVGASVGLALRRYNKGKEARQQFAVTGYDPRQSMMSSAEARGVADRMVRSPQDVVRGKDIVFFALPYAEVQAAYRLLAPTLRSDAVILDASPLKLPSQEWARKHLPDSIHTVGVTPILNAKYLYDGLDDANHAAEDLFDDGAMLLMPDPRANADAVQLATDFSSILGAAAHFVDPVEHDGLAAAVEGLPALLGVAMFQMLLRSDGWSDARRAGNPALGSLIHHLHDTHPDDLRDLIMLNRENTLRYLSEYIEVLESFRDTLARGDRAALEAAVVSSEEAYRDWVLQRASNRWERRGEVDDSGRPSVMDGLFGSFLSKRIRGNKG